MFYVGQKVVMVDDFGPISKDLAIVEDVVLPVKGPVYTVRDIEENICGNIFALTRSIMACAPMVLRRLSRLRCSAPS